MFRLVRQSLAAVARPRSTALPLSGRWATAAPLPKSTATPQTAGYSMFARPASLIQVCQQLAQIKFTPTTSLASPLNSSFTSLLGSRTARRFNSTLQPRKYKHRKAHKGRIPVRIGGSQKGNFMHFGDYGLRVKHGVRLTGRQLDAIIFDIKRRLKPFKGSQVWLRVFPDIPVSGRGTEVRMGKGKGDFEYWACRVPKDKIILEIGGAGIRPEMAKELLRVAIHKMPVKTVVVYREAEEKKALAATAAAESTPATVSPTPVASSTSSQSLAV